MVDSDMRERSGRSQRTGMPAGLVVSKLRHPVYGLGPFAGRAGPPLRIARLRAEGKVLEIGPGDLALTHGEASLLLRNADVVLDEDDVAKLHQRTEGWPAGLYLAALYLREGGALADAVV